jgi:hypothetical protein
MYIYIYMPHPTPLYAMSGHTRLHYMPSMTTPTSTLYAIIETCAVDLSILDILGLERMVLIIEVSSFQGLEMYYGKAWREGLHYLWFQWHMSIIKGRLQFRGLD